MKLALRELRRRPGRFSAAGLILTLIALLLMFLGGLLDGLIRSSTGAMYALDGDVVVYTASAEDSFLRSRIDPETRATVEAVPGVAEVGGIGVAQLGARVPGNDARDLADVALFGYQLPPDGVPEPPAAGEAYAAGLRNAGGAARTVCFAGMIHDFVALHALADAPATRAAITEATAALRAALYGP